MQKSETGVLIYLIDTFRFYDEDDDEDDHEYENFSKQSSARAAINWYYFLNFLPQEDLVN